MTRTRMSTCVWDLSVPDADRVPLDAGLLPPFRLTNGSVKLPVADDVGDQLLALWESSDWVRDYRAMDQSPKNAWLLVGDQESLDVLNTAEESFWFADLDHIWTAPKQVQPGDVLFFYFMAPHKEVKFVARAASFASFANDIPVLGGRAGMHQWWVHYARLEPIEPIPLDMLREAFDGHLILRGRPSYVPPQVVERLLPRIDPEVIDVTGIAVPTGLDELPPPEEVDLSAWTQIAAGALTLESHVEDYIVEPLLRLAFASHNDVTWSHQHRIDGAGVADYSVSRRGALRSVIEVKLGARYRETANNTESPDFAQLLRYAEALDMPGMLIDANRMFLFQRGERVPSEVFARADFTTKELNAVAVHLTR